MEQGLNHSNVSNLKHDDQTINQPIKVGEDDWGRNRFVEDIGRIYTDIYIFINLNGFLLGSKYFC